MARADSAASIRRANVTVCVDNSAGMFDFLMSELIADVKALINPPRSPAKTTIHQNVSATLLVDASWSLAPAGALVATGDAEGVMAPPEAVVVAGDAEGALASPEAEATAGDEEEAPVSPEATVAAGSGEGVLASPEVAFAPADGVTWLTLLETTIAGTGG